ncbi:site-2 protease family protein [Patescibacteria group bacterium]|nr:site-2 protease family protein [Patescibacteria group bacterium]
MFIADLLSHPDRLIFFVIAIIIGITVHEFSHAWAATRLGDSTAKLSGRLTLNPLSHMDPLGTIMLFVVGLGWGRPVPYNPHFVRQGVWGETLVALAGPVSNIIMATLFALPDRIMFWVNGVHPTGQLFTFFSTIVAINVILAAFNLFPIPPLDGSKILHLIVDKLFFGKVNWMVFERSGPMILLAVIFAERLLNVNIIFRILDPIIFLINLIVGSSSPFA